MKKNQNCCIYLLVFVTFTFIFSDIQAQVITNKIWTTLNSNPVSGVDWSASVVDPLGNIITTGNSINASGNISLLLAKQSSSGQILWEQEYSANQGSKDYGIALTTDSYGNVYVAGATFSPLNQNHDYLILKYDSSGVLLWSYTENGSDNGEDIPSAIMLDNSNNVYVTGGSYSNTSNYDFRY